VLSVKQATTLVFDSFSGNSLVYLIVSIRQKFPLVSVIAVVGLANVSCCCDHFVNVSNKPDKKKCERKDSSLRTNFALEPRDQRFPGSISLSLRRAGRREPWERGCNPILSSFNNVQHVEHQFELRVTCHWPICPCKLHGYYHQQHHQNLSYYLTEQENCVDQSKLTTNTCSTCKTKAVIKAFSTRLCETRHKLAMD